MLFKAPKKTFSPMSDPDKSVPRAVTTPPITVMNTGMMAVSVDMNGVISAIRPLKVPPSCAPKPFMESSNPGARRVSASCFINVVAVA